MRQISVLILILALHLGAAPFLHAESSDPSELFLSAYMSVQNGEKLEGEGKYKLALQKYRYAATLLEQTHDKTPDWQPLIVDYRTKKTSESIANIEKKISLEGPGNTHEEPETPLPQKSEDGSAPSVSITPSGSAPMQDNSAGAGFSTSGSDAFDSATGRLRAKFDQMQAELNATKQKYLDVQRQNAELADKLDDTIKKLDKAHIDESQLKSQLTQAEEAYKNSIADKTRDVEGQKQLKDEVARLQNLLKDTQAERDVEQETNDDLSQRLKGTKGERDIAVKQRDEAVDSLNKAKEGQQQVDKLMAENTALVQKLNDAEKTIAQFNSDAPTKDATIAGLKKEVSDTKDQLAAALKQGQENQNSMSDLQKQLESATNELSQAKAATTSDDKKKLTDENELLRGIVMRERKEEAHRDQEKKLVLAELQKLHVQSNALVEKINYLGQPVIKLTPQERSLFKQPQIAISDQDISIAIQKPEISPSPTAAASATSAASPVPAPSTTPLAPAPSPSATPAVPAPSASPEPTTASPTPTSTAAPSSTPDQVKPDAGNDAPHVQTTLAPPVPPELVAQANEAKEDFERGHYRDAEKTYESMLSQQPNNIYILSNLGVVRFRSGKLKSAEETFRKAIVVAPDDAFSHCTLGIVYYSQGKLDEAVGELTKALAINPKNQTAHNYLGITAAAKGWVEAARKELETAVRIDPNYADAQFNLAVIYLTTPPKDAESAKKHYKRAVELGSEADPALEALLNKP